MNTSHTFTKISFLALTLLLSSILLQGTTTYAQLPQGIEQIHIEVDPAAPQPNDEVILTARSFSTDLNRAQLVWSVNGKIVEQGPGKTQVEIQLSGPGSQSVIRLVAETVDRGMLSKEITIRPSSVNLLWETETYTPPFYKGKALQTSRSAVRIVAMPELIDKDGTVIPAEDLVYTWKKGYKVLGSLSGRGRDTLTIDGAPLFNTLDISVEVESVDFSTSAKKQIFITAFSPQIIFYEDHPTKGVLFEQAIGNSFNLHQEEATFLAVPLFFSGKRRDDADFTYSWNLNGEKISSTNIDPSIITLRPEKESRGKAAIGLSIRTAKNILQGARTQLSVQFGTTIVNQLF